MKKRVLALAAASALALSLTACGGAEAPSAPPESLSEEAASVQTVEWLVEPRSDLEIAVSMAELGQPRNPERAAGLANQGELAFFGQNGGFGVIDLDGNIVIPASEGAVWCSLCGITNQDESIIFDGEGNHVGVGGHDGGGSNLMYDPDRQQFLDGDMIMVQPVQPGQNTGIRAARVVRITEAADGIGNGHYLYSEEAGDIATTEEPLGTWVLMGTDAQPLLDGEQLEDVAGLWNLLRGSQLTDDPVREGLILVKQNGLWNYLDAETCRVHLGGYLNARPFVNGRAAVRTESGWGYIDRDGTELTPMLFEDAASVSPDGRAWVRTEDGWGVIALPKAE